MSCQAQLRPPQSASSDIGSPLSCQVAQSISEGNGEIFWNDGLQSLRRVFWKRHDQPPERPLALVDSIHLETVADQFWFGLWAGGGMEMAIKDIPDEVPLSTLLDQLGIPPSAALNVGEQELNALKNSAIAERIEYAQQLLRQELDWVVDLAPFVQLRKAREFLPSIGEGDGCLMGGNNTEPPSHCAREDTCEGEEWLDHWYDALDALPVPMRETSSQ
eukprot:TRINITY_DN3598_c0_g1_i3.p1 TRINITY_DN3598_c0_g1~~TRINITY_DN3598_c0_g1_i3.p1  ORF type:complete len:218 (-),score=29.21 TRINITY_DN3598_c0_g1_i3:286-939(-)